ncbi:MAG: hypothetical protein GC151_02725 [Betaproteobacteria bacterium]|nr:hypothetical protein [Betaproteobacteria bacterium]
MTSLAAIQEAFQASILSGQDAVPGAIAGHIALTARGVDIYRNAYRSRLVDVLSETFETVREALGHDTFAAVARSYVENRPSTFRNVRWFGDAFADHLARSPATRDSVWIAELARFEWALTLAFDAADDAVVRVDALAAVAPESWAGLRFTCHASLQRLRLVTNAPALRKARDASTPLPEPRTADTPAEWAIWRAERDVRFRSLDVQEARTLDSLREGVPFAMLCEQLLDEVPESGVAVAVASWLRRWVEDGLIATFSPDGPS